MRILIRREDFVACYYDLYIGSTALEFNGENDKFSLLYVEISDFCVTRGKRGDYWFSMISGDQMYEGKVLMPEELESFTEALKEKLGGAIKIEVKRI